MTLSLPGTVEAAGLRNPAKVPEGSSLRENLLTWRNVVKPDKKSDTTEQTVQYPALAGFRFCKPTILISHRRLG